MRFALRNKNKIIEKYNEHFYDKLLYYLSIHAQEYEYPQRGTGTIKGYEYFETSGEKFLIIKKVFDVYTVAYYPRDTV